MAAAETSSNLTMRQVAGEPSMTDDAVTRAQAFEDSQNAGSNDSANPTIGDVIAQRYRRRDLLKGALGAAAIAATVSPLALAAGQRAHAANSRFDFEEVAAGVDATHHVADDYDADVLIRWGDPVLPGAPAFDPMRQSAAAQKAQFGYNPARPTPRSTACWW
jgi:secreted PhoX family phosphatase